jgi:hypothetical protein
MLGFLYEHKLLKQNSALFKLWCCLSYRKLYQVLNIPIHFIKGFYYRYNLKQIVYFCLGIIKNRIYKQQYKLRELDE